VLRHVKVSRSSRNVLAFQVQVRLPEALGQGVSDDADWKGKIAWPVGDVGCQLDVHRDRTSGSSSLQVRGSSELRRGCTG